MKDTLENELRSSEFTASQQTINNVESNNPSPLVNEDVDYDELVQTKNAADKKSKKKLFWVLITVFVSFGLVTIVLVCKKLKIASQRNINTPLSPKSNVVNVNESLFIDTKPTETLPAETPQDQKYILFNGNPDIKIDLVFIPYEFEDYNQTKDLVEQATASFFSKEPFASFKERFNISYISNSIDQIKYECKSGLSLNRRQTIYCSTENVIEGYEDYKADYIIVLANDPNRALGSYASAIMLLSSADIRLNVFVHEMGHMFGLSDEYANNSDASVCANSVDNESCYQFYIDSFMASPNIDTLGCPKWCDNYNLYELLKENEPCSQKNNKMECMFTSGISCVWFEDEHPFLNSKCVIPNSQTDIGLSCQEGTGCYMGAVYGQLMFRSSSISMMGNAGQKYDFNAASKDHIEKVINCCFPRNDSTQCNGFRNTLMSDTTTKTSEYLRERLKRIVNCK